MTPPMPVAGHHRHATPGTMLKWGAEAVGLVLVALVALAVLAALVAVALIAGPFVIVPFAVLVLVLVTRGLFR